jgi:hypothetical protein
MANKKITGTTTSGFKYELEQERLDNYELLEYIVELEENPLMLPKVIDLLLGKDQKEKLKEHVRTENGIVPAEKLSDEITEIFEGQAETKK